MLRKVFKAQNAFLIDKRIEYPSKTCEVRSKFLIYSPDKSHATRRAMCS